MVSKFVGQRVRLVRPHVASNFWIEGRISSICHLPIGAPIPGTYMRAAMESNCVVAWDDGSISPQFLYQLEPILPEGSQPLGYSFEQMMSEFGFTEAVK